MAYNVSETLTLTTSTMQWSLTCLKKELTKIAEKTDSYYNHCNYLIIWLLCSSMNKVCHLHVVYNFWGKTCSQHGHHSSCFQNTCIYIVVDNCLWHCDWMLVSIGGRWSLAPGTSLNAVSQRDELGQVRFEVACDADEQPRMQFRWQQRCMAVLEMIPHENLPGYNRLNGLLFLGNSDWTTAWIFVLDDGFNTLLTLLYFSSKYLVNLVHVFHVIPILRLLKV